MLILKVQLQERNASCIYKSAANYYAIWLGCYLNLWTKLWTRNWSTWRGTFQYSSNEKPQSRIANTDKWRVATKSYASICVPLNERWLILEEFGRLAFQLPQHTTASWLVIPPSGQHWNHMLSLFCRPIIEKVTEIGECMNNYWWLSSRFLTHAHALENLEEIHETSV
jgi:hypothetical protein